MLSIYRTRTCQSFLRRSLNARTMSSSVKIVLLDPTDPRSARSDAYNLWETAKVAQGEKHAKVGTTRIFYGQPQGTGATAVVSLGESYAKSTGDARREIIRKAVGSAVKQVKSLGEGVKAITIDASDDPHAAAVAAYLARFKFDLKTKPPSFFNPNDPKPDRKPIELAPVEPSKEWDSGVIYAEAQNLARTLKDLPANIITPTEFTDRVKNNFKSVANTEVIVHDEAWAAEKGMRLFLSVTKGTDEPAKFLEIHYKGGKPDAAPLALVGKGITFDSGGISLKPGANMKLMRGDMGGAAAVVSATLAIAKLKLPINVVTITPLCENLPGPSASKPGDIIYGMNGKSVEIDNTDAEGRLVLADALYYAGTTFKPHTIIDVATLTGAMDIALGEIYSGVFTDSDTLWDQLHSAGQKEHDRLWRMPLSDDYGPQIQGSNADLCNTGGRPGGSCTAALFLKNFVPGVEKVGDAEPSVNWAHIDIAGTMEATRPTAYLETGMTGSSTRALIEFARQLAQ